jgi:hypothetical protein
VPLGGSEAKLAVTAAPAPLTPTINEGFASSDTFTEEGIPYANAGIDGPIGGTIWNLCITSSARFTFNDNGRKLGWIKISLFWEIWFLVITSKSVKDLCINVVMSVAF